MNLDIFVDCRTGVSAAAGAAARAAAEHLPVAARAAAVGERPAAVGAATCDTAETRAASRRDPQQQPTAHARAHQYKPL